MEKTGLGYEIGDQIVHSYYGVGMITGIVERNLGEKVIRYYRVETKNSTYYLPVEKAWNSRVRPLISEDILQEVKQTLQTNPRIMDEDYKIRRKRIKEVRSSGSIIPMAKIIRDMNFRQATHKLTDAEARELNQFEEKIAQEWAACEEIGIYEALECMQSMLLTGIGELQTRE